MILDGYSVSDIESTKALSKLNVNVRGEQAFMFFYFSNICVVLKYKMSPHVSCQG